MESPTQAWFNSHFWLLSPSPPKNPTCIFFCSWTSCLSICTSSRFLEPRKWRATCSGSMLVTRASFQRRISYTRSFWLWTSIFHKNKVLANFSTCSGGGRGEKCHPDNVVQNPTFKFDIPQWSAMPWPSWNIYILNESYYLMAKKYVCIEIYALTKNRNTFYVGFFVFVFWGGVYALKQWNSELLGFKKTDDSSVYRNRDIFAIWAVL